jgi:hypothetical protein
MDNIELFEKHLSGELSDTEATKFYSRLAIDEEMRNNFQSFASLQKGIQKSISTFEPSAALKSAVFANAGFSGFSKVASLTSSTATILASSFFSKYLPVFAAAVLSSILTGFTFFTYFNNSEDLQEELISTNYLSEELPAIPKPVFNLDYNETQRTPIISQNKIQTITDDNTLENTDVENTVLIKDISESIAFFNLTENINKESYSEKMNNNISTNKSYDKLEITELSEKLYDILGNVSIEFSGIDNVFFDEQNVFSANMKPFINKNIGINYNINDYLYAGFSFRGENYYLTYTSIDEDNTRYIYEQQPILYSYNIYAGAETEIYRYFNPFIKLTAGTTKIGPVARADAGLGINITNSIQLFGGVGYDAIFFQHQNRDFNSNKWNINYGIKYNF